ncbi:unnamed protein product [Natator depressus]
MPPVLTSKKERLEAIGKYALGGLVSVYPNVEVLNMSHDIPPLHQHPAVHKCLESDAVQALC